MLTKILQAAAVGSLALSPLPAQEPEPTMREPAIPDSLLAGPEYATFEEAVKAYIEKRSMEIENPIAWFYEDFERRINADWIPIAVHIPPESIRPSELNHHIRSDLDIQDGVLTDFVPFHPDHKGGVMDDTYTFWVNYNPPDDSRLLIDALDILSQDSINR